MRQTRPLVERAVEFGVVLRPGWKLADPAIEADAKALWRRLSVLPGGIDPDHRADEIVSAAYVGDQLAGVSTAFIREIEFLRSRFAMFRCAVAPEFRRHGVMRALVSHSRDVLEQWSREHPEAQLMGMAGVTQNPEIAAVKLPPVQPTSGMVLVGFTPEGARIRVAWFDHALI